MANFIKCKWAGDKADEFCKECNGCTMLVNGESVSCTECGGYEAGEEVVQDAVEESPKEDIQQKEPIKEEVGEPDENPKKQAVTNKNENEVNNTKKEKTSTTAKKSTKKQEAKVIETSKEQKEEKVTTEDGIKVMSIRYTSGATVKKGDNYYKIVAEEEWQCVNLDDSIRKKLWDKLNTEVDNQVNDIFNM
jgi:microcompartment protein CcmL/EutN|nr:MAG TPA_asm: hypothetical protein [Caudoviricetes sp.]